MVHAGFIHSCQPVNIKQQQQQQQQQQVLLLLLLLLYTVEKDLWWYPHTLIMLLGQSIPVNQTV